MKKLKWILVFLMVVVTGVLVWSTVTMAIPPVFGAMLCLLFLLIVVGLISEV